MIIIVVIIIINSDISAELLNISKDFLFVRAQNILPKQHHDIRVPLMC